MLQQIYIRRSKNLWSRLLRISGAQAGCMSDASRRLHASCTVSHAQKASDGSPRDTRNGRRFKAGATWYLTATSIPHLKRPAGRLLFFQNLISFCQTNTHWLVTCQDSHFASCPSSWHSNPSVEVQTSRIWNETGSRSPFGSSLNRGKQKYIFASASSTSNSFGQHSLGFQRYQSCDWDWKALYLVNYKKVKWINQQVAKKNKNRPNECI